jgi:hypothetical protein
MFGRARINNRPEPDGETRQPLLDRNGSDEHLPASETVFSVDDSDDDTPLSSLPSGIATPSRRVHFQEQVQVYVPPLRSTMESREARACTLRSCSSTVIKNGNTNRIRLGFR